MHGRMTESSDCLSRSTMPGEALRNRASLLNAAAPIPTRSVTQRLEVMQNETESVRARLAEVSARVGGDFCEQVSPDFPPTGSGVHGQIDELARTLTFINNITNALLERV